MLRPELVTLYKYLPISEHSITALRTRAFWFANPRSFNDPFDCALAVAEDGLRDSVEHALSTITSSPRYVPGSIPAERLKPDSHDAEAFATFREGVGRVFEEMGLLCLTESCDNLLMWGHYSSSHTGICVGFERSPTNMVGRLAHAVTYRREYPRLTLADFERTLNPNSVDQLWLTKASDWSYEREWRLVANPGNRSYGIDACVTQLVFGVRHRARLTPVCSTPGTRSRLRNFGFAAF